MGLSELFFEGAEPTLSDFPLADLLALFPEGTYEFEGRTVDGAEISGEGTLTHAVPAGPDVSASDKTVGAGNSLTIRWQPVTKKATDPAGGVFPDEDIVVVAYQVIVEPFQVTLPATKPPAPMSVTVPPEFVENSRTGRVRVRSVGDRKRWGTRRSRQAPLRSEPLRQRHIHHMKVSGRAMGLCFSRCAGRDCGAHE